MRNIMVVDDDPDLRLLYRSVLQADGYAVTTVGSAEECLKRVAMDPPDLVVMDIRLPGMDGIEAMGQILARHRSMRVILHSAYVGYRDNFLTWLADDYILKKSDPKELLGTVNRLLNRPRERRLADVPYTAAGNA